MLWLYNYLNCVYVNIIYVFGNKEDFVIVNKKMKKKLDKIIG